MSSYHQIGHNSENLLFDSGLTDLAGAILSPLNYKPDAVAKQIEKLKSRTNFRTILDPHLYKPQSERMCLPHWAYYPKDVETTDFNPGWWASIVNKLAETAIAIGPDTVASPAIVPRNYPDAYYVDLVSYGSQLAEALSGTKITSMQTVVARLEDLTSVDRVMSIASIVSQGRLREILLVLVCDREPRREIVEVSELKGAMRLIATLEQNGFRVTVASSSSEMLLWKAAGASNCATGKFFNLRRFTISRFDEPDSGGGGQLGYWFEEELLAFLRQSDLLRVINKGVLSDASRRNPFSQQILDCIRGGKPWVGLSWRHFLYWFADAEDRLTKANAAATSMIEKADAAWKLLETSSPAILMEERNNDGSWVRAWRRAILEYPHPDATVPTHI